MSGSTSVNRWRKAVLLVFFYALVALVAAELSVRWFVRMSDLLFTSDPHVGIGHIPNKTGRWISDEFDVVVPINAHGFHDRERAERKPPGTWRVIALGDSMTEALQVPLDETFVSILERRLKRPRPSG